MEFISLSSSQLVEGLVETPSRNYIIIYELIIISFDVSMNLSSHVALLNSWFGIFALKKRNLEGT